MKWSEKAEKYIRRDLISSHIVPTYDIGSDGDVSIFISVNESNLTSTEATFRSIAMDNPVSQFHASTLRIEISPKEPNEAATLWIIASLTHPHLSARTVVLTFNLAEFGHRGCHFCGLELLESFFMLVARLALWNCPDSIVEKSQAAA